MVSSSSHDDGNDDDDDDDANDDKDAFMYVYMFVSIEAMLNDAYQPMDLQHS